MTYRGWYADGVDIIYTAAGGSGAGTIEAAVEAGKWAIGGLVLQIALHLWRVVVNR